MIIYGLIGHPLGHSFSKTYFTEKFAREGLDFRYENFDLEDVSQVSDLFSIHPEIMGLNVTAPYKETILDYIDDYDAIVAEIKSSNTLKRMPDGRIVGFNTDVIGFDALLDKVCRDYESRRSFSRPSERLSSTNGGHDTSLECAQVTTETSRALILGTGGASKAVQYVLRKRGIPFELVSRDPRRGAYTYVTSGREEGQPAPIASSKTSSIQADFPHEGSALTSAVVAEHRIIINATPLGTYPKVEEAPALPYDAITADHLLIDLIYNPEETRFLREGRLRGATTCNGLLMLHAQAEASWHIWTAPR